MSRLGVVAPCDQDGENPPNVAAPAPVTRLEKIAP